MKFTVEKCAWKNGKLINSTTYSMGAKVIILEEFKLRRDLADVQDVIKQADYLISLGMEIPQSDIDDLLLWELELEQLLEKYDKK